jgi:aryl-alcohol dehydrogenase-like predicted oxidoreductase
MPATVEGTRRFVESQPLERHQNYRQMVDGLWVSSVGLGTYLGEPDDLTDSSYQAAFAEAIRLGCNLFDCAINYRFQRSERALGSWLRKAIADGSIQRDQVVIATKGGFVPFDSALPDDPGKWTYQEFIGNGIAHAHEFCANYQHCITPAYLETMIAWSQRNLGLDTIDIYYLHNPETQRISLSRDTFRARMLDAFETLEQAVDKGQISSYGTATWTGYRALPDTPDYLSLTEIVGLAAQVAGPNHHFRYVQLPYNLFRTEAFALENQQVGDQFLSTFEAAEQLGLTVMCSAPLMQGKLAAPLMPQIAEVITGLNTDAQRAIQFVRSSPGVTSALVGMSIIDHVQENLELMGVPAIEGQVIRGLYSR